jgi:hypothetical protein
MMHHCAKDGCKASITGLEDLPLATVLKIFPLWYWDGGRLWCPRHRLVQR